MATLDAKQKFDLITENLAEVLNPEIIEGVLAEGRSLKIYWGGLAPTPTGGSTLGASLLTGFLSSSQALRRRGRSTAVTLSPPSRSPSISPRAAT